jgi:23S rRNA pseudouridine1911/1915/1917 synthase
VKDTNIEDFIKVKDLLDSTSLISRIEIVVVREERKFRLEDLLCQRFPALSKMYLREVVKKGSCEVNGRQENIGHRLSANDFVEIEVDLSRQHSMLPEALPIEIVYEDEDLVVVDKPAGMLVHPSHREKNGTLLNALAFHFNRDPARGVIRPGLVHRLDKETSGLIVVAKNQRAHRILCRQFQRKQVEKRYTAIVHGVMSENEGVINGDIGRDAELKFWVLKEGGKASETRFRVLQRKQDTTLVELEPVTGRTNQLRIHCASIGHPIIGDKERGGDASRKLCLHATKLGFRHPADSTDRKLISKPPFSL